MSNKSESKKEPKYPEIGARLAQFLEMVELNQRQFALALDSSAQVVSHLVAGHAMPSGATLKMIAEKWPNFNATWLLTGHGEAFPGGKFGEKKEPMLPGGTLTESGATARKKGSRPLIDFDEADTPIHQSSTSGIAVPQTDEEFRNLLIARINEYKKQVEKLEGQLESKDNDYRKLHRVLERLQDSYSIMETELQEARAELRGKEVGNQPAPGSYSSEPAAPIGFQVRAMYPNGIPVYTESEPAEEMAA